MKVLQLLLSLTAGVVGFAPSHLSHRSIASVSSLNLSSIKTSHKTALQSTAEPEVLPQAFSTGYSTNPSLSKALSEATLSALSNHPSSSIDLAIVHVSSLYEEPSKIISHVLDTVSNAGGSVKHIVGNTAGGIISTNFDEKCHPMECEAVPAASVTLASLPDVTISTHYWNDVPELEGGYDSGPDLTQWKQCMGMEHIKDEEEPVFMIIPSPAFQKDLNDFLSGLSATFPSGQTFGGIASTVSSLSRARIFAHSVENNSASSVYGDGCVGVTFTGDVRVDLMVAQGAKPVGGVYRVVAAGATNPNTASGSISSSIEDEGRRSTISAIVLDEAATSAVDEETDNEEMDNENNDTESMDEKELKRAQMAQNYAKARIPKPPLAEANFLMKRLSDDDQAFMRRALLIGLERGNLINTPNELARLANGDGHRFTVRQVASAGMKDGSVTFPLGSVNVEVGARCRFFVRDGDFAKEEVEALWTGYKKKELERTLLGDEEVNPPTGCFVYPTLDRGSKLFGKSGFESSGISSVSGFFANGVLGGLDGTIAGNTPGSNENMLHGSSSQYIIFRSKTKRPIHSPAQATIKAAIALAAKAEEDAANAKLAAEDEKRTAMSKTFSSEKEAAPRSADGEL
eukprot:scaffold166848_cov76-Cyclotella_meneghiniana.AAC.3